VQNINTEEMFPKGEKWGVLFENSGFNDPLPPKSARVFIKI